jgi:hypothetical protein
MLTRSVVETVAHVQDLCPLCCYLDEQCYLSAFARASGVTIFRQTVCLEFFFQGTENTNLFSFSLLSRAKAAVVVSMATVALETLVPGTFGNGTAAKSEDLYPSYCGMWPIS